MPTTDIPTPASRGTMRTEVDLLELGLDPGPALDPALHLLGAVWIASCPTCGYQLATARTQARVERRAAGRICPICREDDAA